MKRIIKGDPPGFWISFIRKHPKITYMQLNNEKDGPAMRSRLHEYICKEQGNICCYCCKLEKNNSHNEHLKPKGGKYISLSMDYRNIFASCSTSGTCGKHKDNRFDEKLFISPLEEDCESYFRFYPNGGIDSNHERGKKTIEILNLNGSRTLRSNRERLFKKVYDFCKFEAESLRQQFKEDSQLALEKYNLFFNTTIIPSYFSKKEDNYPPFIDMLEYFQRKGYFDYDILVNDSDNDPELRECIS